MLITTGSGKFWYESQRKEIESALDAAVERANVSISKGWNDYLGDRRATLDDFCVFVKENGYMIIAIWVYKKLPKANKKKIEKSYYEYQLIPEAW